MRRLLAMDIKVLAVVGLKGRKALLAPTLNSLVRNTPGVDSSDEVVEAAVESTEGRSEPVRDLGDRGELHPLFAPKLNSLPLRVVGVLLLLSLMPMSLDCSGIIK